MSRSASRFRLIAIALLAAGGEFKVNFTHTSGFVFRASLKSLRVVFLVHSAFIFGVSFLVASALQMTDIDAMIHFKDLLLFFIVQVGTNFSTFP